MIRQIDEGIVVSQFFDLFAFLECGDHFDSENQNHIEWLRKRISLRFLQGTKFFAYYLKDNTPAGFLALLIDDGPEGIRCFGKKAEILDFGLFPEHRSKGYGTELLDHVAHFAKENGVYCLYVSTYAKNYSAIAFYGRNGLIPVATLPDVHGPDDEGMVFMRRIL